MTYLMAMGEQPRELAGAGYMLVLVMIVNHCHDHNSATHSCGALP